jgi:hypothetical protein
VSATTLEEEAERLTNVLSEFLVPLRMGEPLNEDTYEKVRRALQRLRPVAAATPVLPKALVRLLVDLYPQLHGIAGLRRHDEDQLMTWAEDLLEDISVLLD